MLVWIPQQAGLVSALSPQETLPATHPLRTIRRHVGRAHSPGSKGLAASLELL